VLKFRLLLIPLLNFICLLFVPLPEAWCYYIDHSDSTPLLIREDAPASQQTVYTIQDNLNLFSEPNPSSPILLPASDNFIAADTIDSNLPIFSLFRNPADLTRDPFANFLYSNLRVKKILREYAELQDRAMALLGSSYQSGTMDLMTRPDSNLQNTTHQEGNTRKDDNLSRALRLLQHNLSAGTAAGNVAAYSTMNEQPGDVKQENPVVSFSELQTLLNRKSILTNTIPGGTPGGYTSPSPRSYQTQSSTDPEQPAQQQAAKTSYNGSGEIKLPWILDLPFKLFDFALAHKTLTLIAGFTCMVLLNIIFGGRS